MKNEYEQHKEMENILKAELDREARAILAEIEADESLKDLTMPDEAEEELMQKIQKLEEKKAAYELLSDEDKEALRLGREVQMQKENKVESDSAASGEEDGKVVAFRRKKKRMYLLVGVVAALVMMMGITSVGEVPLVTSIKEQMFGEKELVQIDSEREDEDSIEVMGERELEIYEEIKDTFNVDIIRLDYRPNGTEVLKYEIDEVLNRATIIYQCGTTIFEYRMIFKYSTQSHGYKVEDAVIEEKSLIIDEIPINLQKCEIENTKEISYVAQFEYQDVYYVFNVTSDFPEEEIEEILKNIKKF